MVPAMSHAPSEREHDIANHVHVVQGKIRIHGQAQHARRCVAGDGRHRRVEPITVAREVRDERVEVLARADPARAEGLEDLVPRGAEGVSEEDRHVGVVGLHALLRVDELDAGGAPEPLTVALLDLRPLRNLGVHVPQVAHAHRGAELVHLGVPADVLDVLGTRHPEVLPLVQERVERGIGEAQSPALDGVEDLRGVEREHGHIAERGGRATAFPHAEGVRGVVDHLEPVPVSDLLNGAHVAEVAVDVHRNDRAGAVRDERLGARRIHRVVLWPHVGHDGPEPSPHDGVHGAREGVRGRDDLVSAVRAELQRLDGALERRVAVREQRHVRHPEVALQPILELGVLRPHVGKPVRLPQGPNLLNVFLHGRHGGPGDQNSVPGHGRLPFYSVIKVPMGQNAWTTPHHLLRRKARSQSIADM